MLVSEEAVLFAAILVKAATVITKTASKTVTCIFSSRMGHVLLLSILRVGQPFVFFPRNDHGTLTVIIFSFNLFF